MFQWLVTGNWDLRANRQTGQHISFRLPLYPAIPIWRLTIGKEKPKENHSSWGDIVPFRDNSDFDRYQFKINMGSQKGVQRIWGPDVAKPSAFPRENTRKRPDQASIVVLKQGEGGASKRRLDLMLVFCQPNACLFLPGFPNMASAFLVVSLYITPPKKGTHQKRRAMDIGKVLPNQTSP